MKIKEYEQLKFRMYSLAPDPSEHCDDCPFDDWMDGPLCLIAGDYIEEQPSAECKAAREKLNKETK